LRGSAALLVCVSHLSAFLFFPFNQIASPGVSAKVFYFFSTLGHQAVLLFFVLSGFFVGGNVIKLYQQQRWSWSKYLLRRLTRLWVVLIPALLLTLFWDILGEGINSAGYHGAFFQISCSGPDLTSPANHRPLTFIGNIFFLQNIVVPVYGSNGPLWSISNEFWYYLIFPIILGIFVSYKAISRGGYLILAILCAVFLPRIILTQGLAWILGAGVFYCLQKECLHNVAYHPLFLKASMALTLLILVLSRLGKLGALFDVTLAIGFTPLVAALAVRPVPEGVYSQVSAAAAEFSYTLYLVHFPVMAFVSYSLFGGRQISLGFEECSLFFVFLMIIILYAAAIWWCFERNTDRIRKFIEGHLLS
jgi:peptidoglycan/LPS O-acetylase OafA/YrhL